MDKKRIEELAKDPRFIPGIYNYCDRWCERCAFTSRCMTYALEQEEPNDPKSQDIENRAFWDKLHNIFQITLEMVREKAGQMGINLDEIDHEKFARQDRQVRNRAKTQPYSIAAESYIGFVNEWFDLNNELFEKRADELLSLVQADIPGTKPEEEISDIHDCLEVIRWYQHQIYVKLCRAATGMIRDEYEETEYSLQDANGSAKVAIIGIERSIAAWGRLLDYLPEKENSILDLLISLKKLLNQVEVAFPEARKFLRPGFDINVE